MDKFEFILRNDKRRLYDRFAILIFILNGLAILYFLFFNFQKIVQKGHALLSILLILLTLLTYFIPRNRNMRDTIFLFAAISIAFYWALMGYWWFSLVLVLLFFLYWVSKRKLLVTILTDKIIYPSFPKRIIHWDELSNMMLKDGLLTIDFNSNKIIQQLIENEGDSTDEKEFNDFCNRQLKK